MKVENVDMERRGNDRGIALIRFRCHTIVLRLSFTATGLDWHNYLLIHTNKGTNTRFVAEVKTQELELSLVRDIRNGAFSRYGYTFSCVLHFKLTQIAEGADNLYQNYRVRHRVTSQENCDKSWALCCCRNGSKWIIIVLVLRLKAN